MQLARIGARDGKTDIVSLKGLISAIKDATLQEQGYLTLAGALRESRRNSDAIEICLILSGKFPDSELADDALLMAGQIYLELRKYDAARSEAEQIISRYKTSDSVDGARLILAKLYLMNDENYNPAMACRQWEMIATATQADSPPQTVIEPDFTRICSNRP